MASIHERNGKFCVVYNYVNADGKRKQKWETYETRAEAKRRKKEIEYRTAAGSLVVPKCKYLRELLNEYVDLYGRDTWAVSTYSSNVRLINNYILPLIGNAKLCDINTRYLERYYQQLLKTKAVINPIVGRARNEYVGTATIRDIHKILRSCFKQAVKWEMMPKNPAVHATVPKYKSKKRDIWDAETLMHALDVCEDNVLLLAMNLAFAGSLRMGEMLALTWDCVDVSREAIDEGRSFIFINKELQRVSKDAMKKLDGKDILMVFPEEGKLNKTVRVLKTPKTESSVRKVFLPSSVAEMLAKTKKEQDEIQELIGEEYHDYGLVMATPYGMPVGETVIREKFQRLIDQHDLPQVVFHSLRHSSVTYKLKLNGGDIKSVQGDSGHSQVNMVTDVYSHIMDDDRQKNAALLEEAFYARKDLSPKMHAAPEGRSLEIPEGVDMEVLAKALENPEMMALLASLAKAMGK